MSVLKDEPKADDKDEIDRKKQLMVALDDMYNELTIEHAVEQTDYSHRFKENKVVEGAKSSPY